MSLKKKSDKILAIGVALRANTLKMVVAIIYTENRDTVTTEDDEGRRLLA